MESQPGDTPTQPGRTIAAGSAASAAVGDIEPGGGEGNPHPVPPVPDEATGVSEEDAGQPQETARWQEVAAGQLPCSDSPPSGEDRTAHSADCLNGLVAEDGNPAENPNGSEEGVGHTATILAADEPLQSSNTSEETGSHALQPHDDSPTSAAEDNEVVTVQTGFAVVEISMSSKTVVAEAGVQRNSSSTALEAMGVRGTLSPHDMADLLRCWRELQEATEKLALTVQDLVVAAADTAGDGESSQEPLATTAGVTHMVVPGTTVVTETRGVHYSGNAADTLDGGRDAGAHSTEIEAPTASPQAPQQARVSSQVTYQEALASLHGALLLLKRESCSPQQHVSSASDEEEAVGECHAVLTRVGYLTE